MCGRFTITTDRVEIILDKFKAELAPGFGGYKPRYNAAPGQSVPVIVTKDGKRFLTNMFWGFVPPWGEKSDGSTVSQANIRDDTIERNKFFKERILTNRCVFVADGFYEWKKPEGYENLVRGKKLPKGVRKIPYRIILKNKEIFALAGLWRSIDIDEKKIVTAGIITTNPNELMKPIHDRMPVILEEEKLISWLNPEVRSFNELSKQLEPYPKDEMDAYVVSNVVNNSRDDSPECIERLK
ncbi:MAG: SOS response-associated peptidase [Ignavibacteriales bacterium]|nr:SOS response-associated peptidase [Ignavibacteriales bacterium]